jgi:DNA-binding PadR family transcriptional regulator
MPPQQREQVRLSILRYCQSSAISPGLITSYLKAEGFTGIGGVDVYQEIQYLVDKGLLVAEPKVISPECGLYRITANGRDYLATQGQE